MQPVVREVLLQLAILVHHRCEVFEIHQPVLRAIPLQPVVQLLDHPRRTQQSHVEILRPRIVDRRPRKADNADPMRLRHLRHRGIVPLDLFQPSPALCCRQCRWRPPESPPPGDADPSHPGGSASRPRSLHGTCQASEPSAFGSCSVSVRENPSFCLGCRSCS